LLAPMFKTKTLFNDFEGTQKLDFYTWKLFNNSRNYRFKDLNSGNLSFLTSEKNLRLLLKKKNWRSSIGFETKTDVVSSFSKNHNLGSNLNRNYLYSKIKWINLE
jgi:hypothetical protein